MDDWVLSWYILMGHHCEELCLISVWPAGFKCAILLPSQVFANAFLFNPRESNVGVMATTLQVGTCACSLQLTLQLD